MRPKWRRSAEKQISEISLKLGTSRALFFDNLRGNWFFVAGRVSVLISRLLYTLNYVFDSVHMSWVFRIVMQLMPGEGRMSTKIFGMYFWADHRNFGRIKIHKNEYHPLNELMLIEIPFNLVNSPSDCASLHHFIGIIKKIQEKVVSCLAFVSYCIFTVGITA